MSGKSRVKRLMPELTARERAVLCVRALHAGEREDPQIRFTMPEEQIDRFNELLTLANGVLHILIPHALVLEGQARTMQMRMMWFSSLVSWGDDRWLIHTKLAFPLMFHRDELPKEIQEALDDAQEHFLSPLAPAAPWTLLPKYAEEFDFATAEPQSEGVSGVLCVLGESLTQEIPGLRSQLITLQGVVDEIVAEFQDESVLPESFTELMETTRRVVTDVALAKHFLGELPEGEIDETYDALIRKSLKAQRSWYG